jgi:adenine phosphoribosyltransferase
MDYLSLIDRSKVHFKRSEVSPIFAQPGAFAQLIGDLAAPYVGEGINQVAGLDAMGFIVGTALALKLGVGFIPIRKAGKLPVLHDTESVRDYTGETRSLTLRKGAFPVGTRVLLADEWIETGAQAKAAVALLERAGAVVVGITAIAFRRHAGTAPLWEKYKCFSVWPEAV